MIKIDWELEVLNILPVRMGQDFMDSCRIAGIPDDVANQTLKILMDKGQVELFNNTFVLNEKGKKRIDEVKEKGEETKLEKDALSKKTFKEAMWENKKDVIHPEQSFVRDVAYITATIPFPSEKSMVEVPCLISSERKILKGKELTDDVQLAIKPLNSNPDDNWALSYIQLFIENKNEPTDLKEVFEIVKSKYQFYIDIPDGRQYSLLSLWVIGTYFHQLFDVYPYLFINASKRSGKTKLLNLTSLMGFNAKGFVAPTASSIFRMIRDTLCTLCMDEIEKLNKKDEGDIRAMLLSGYKKGVPVPRTEEISQGNAKVRVVNEYDVYSPKLMANISGMEGTLEDRAITIILLRTDNREIGNRGIQVKRSLPEWQMVRNKLYLNMMLNWKKIQENSKLFDDLCNFIVKDDELEETFVKMRENVGSRHLELWRPMLIIGLSVSKDVFKEVVSLAIDMVAEKDAVDTSENLDVSLLSALVPLIRSDGWYKSSELTRSIKNYEDLDWITGRIVANALGRMKIRSGLRKVGGKKEVFIRVETLQRLAKKFHLDYNSLLEEETEEIMTSKKGKFRQILNICSEEYKEGIPKIILLQELQKAGISEEKSLDMIEDAKTEGYIYEPEAGIYKKSGVDSYL